MKAAWPATVVSQWIRTAHNCSRQAKTCSRRLFNKRSNSRVSRPRRARLVDARLLAEGDKLMPKEPCWRRLRIRGWGESCWRMLSCWKEVLMNSWICRIWSVTESHKNKRCFLRQSRNMNKLRWWVNWTNACWSRTIQLRLYLIMTEFMMAELSFPRLSIPSAEILQYTTPMSQVHQLARDPNWMSLMYNHQWKSRSSTSKNPMEIMWKPQNPCHQLKHKMTKYSFRNLTLNQQTNRQLNKKRKRIKNRQEI